VILARQTAPTTAVFTQQIDGSDSAIAFQWSPALCDA
jgi:hypothetical protein